MNIRVAVTASRWVRVHTYCDIFPTTLVRVFVFPCFATRYILYGLTTSLARPAPWLCVVARGRRVQADAALRVDASCLRLVDGSKRGETLGNRDTQREMSYTSIL